MDIFQIYKEKIITICENIFPDIESRIFYIITAEPPKDILHGDIATNAAMVLAKPANKNPKEIAGIISSELLKDESISSAEIAGAGFINLRLKNSCWYEVANKIVSEPENFGKSNIGNNEKINIEYVSANPTGPMHIGHARNAVIGDVLANILKFTGYNVTKEYYVNDAGAQVEVLAKSAFLRYQEALEIEIGEIPQGLYPGEYLIPVGQELAKIYGNELINSSDAITIIKSFAINKMLELIKQDLASLGVKHDIFTSEKNLLDAGEIEKSIKFLEEKGLVYRGILEAPKGKTPEDWEPREQLLFKSSSFGDDTDRPLQKSDGTYTYFAGDIAYHYNKYKRGFNKMAITLGADHGGYVKRLKAIVKALSNNQAEINVILSQLVNLVENGEPVKMSKRAGNFVTMRDVIDKVGKDVVRFIMLTRKADATIDFDLKKVLETTKDNPVFYVQYAHARICSALRQAVEQGFKIEDAIKTDSLNHYAEIQLIKKLAEYPRILKSASLQMEPHKLPFYLYEVATSFHQLWNLGKEENLRFIDQSNPVATMARLALLKATKFVISSCLSVLEVEALERM